MIPDENPVMKPEEFRLISEFVEEAFGLVLDNGKRIYLGCRLWDRIQDLRLSSFAEYYTYLKFAPHGIEERLKFIPYITNNETYFFREETQLNVFARNVLPELSAQKRANGDKKLRILSAGCSTGEEAYTLAMLVLESGKYAWEWDVKITGIDIDPLAIKRAEEGIYSGRAFQAMSTHYLERYFARLHDGYKVRETLSRITCFLQGNLLDLERIVDNHEVDLIFCRNVLIYFSDDTVKRAVDSFARILASDGLLFLGHSESLSRISACYHPVRYPGSIIYRVRDGA